MKQSRPQRRRKALQFVATLLVALGVIAFAASIALAHHSASHAGGGGSDAGENNNPEACLGYMNGGACKIRVCDGEGGTREINYNAYLQGEYRTENCAGEGDGGDDEGGDGSGSDPMITVCRDGALVQVKTSERGELPLVCPVVENTDACPDEALNPGIQVAGTTCVVANANNNSTPGEAAGGGPVDNGDPAQPGIALEYSSLAPTGVTKDPAVNGEQVVAGAADGPAAGGAGAPGDGGTSAIVTPSGSLPYTGLSTLQVALMGVMLLGLGSLAWLVGNAPRSEVSHAA